ncbi:hypothetical protein [Lutibacter sp. B1]|uniref:hypothetical protein n=1 Tax=Lutibacter sp. B1 TaxID=2725996 RepID=UPI00145673CA|nr:hypothetical protein [Lutibacter sp. B1]NLP58673.1 hypothetical protein [Lutibacter sp. B1]
MKSKIKKDWHNRDKSIDEIHHESMEWISEIDFISDEIRFLNNLLSSNYIDCLDAGLTKKTTIFLKKLDEYKKIGKTLHELINKHETILANLIETNSVTSNINYLKTHKNLDNEVYNYFKKYKRLKKQIFEVVENRIKKKDQKKLI